MKKRGKKKKKRKRNIHIRIDKRQVFSIEGSDEENARVQRQS